MTDTARRQSDYEAIISARLADYSRALERFDEAGKARPINMTDLEIAGEAVTRTARLLAITLHTAARTYDLRVYSR